ncbi:ABC-type amino acid transport substrate-binding protein [Hymenobacter luteus]|uniref:ABC-type amino acid transport substrate-binding protein n=2 Tax=Hymenobacter TaxID=89966 RepID=A0A7W9T3G8_9BACT|nr:MULTISPECIES: hypothetical protein [Hymenobacter]MBB4602482.1 ABC-type amino acid transport substrate-binding protein [Hymenobacter latericoloratus]MBB6060373.1 ABC-type amino acid transport substrate-binding protein [Hymenobacter luteus]
MRFSFLIATGLTLTSFLTAPALVVAQRVKSAPFSYLPERADDRYNQRVTRKTLALPTGGFVILAHKSATEYAVERYDADLKRLWATSLPLSAGETIDAFAQSAGQATVVVHSAGAAQQLSAYTINLATGQKSAAKKLLETGSRDRRPGAAFSADGTKLVVWRYLTREEQIRAISAVVYDEKLQKLKERTYDFHDQGGFFSTTVHVGNDGSQFVTLVSDGMKKLAVRRYRNDSPEVKVMSVSVGGTFGGKEVNVFDSRFALQPDNTLYAAAICNERETGLYYSLKVVKFDFLGEGEMKFAPEVKFTPAYLQEVNQATATTAKRLEDVYLTDLLLTAEQQLVVVGEKKYEEGGDDSPGHTRELHLFGYNEFQTPTWHRIIAKDQVAPATEGFSSISYRAALFGPELQVVTWEKIKNKSDLYLRRINALNGTVQPPKSLGLNVASDQNPSYVKDFTTWLDPKTLIGVSRPSKKSAALMLNKIVVK